ncbi:MAG: hypothetical protein H0T65_21720, partial [Deltaproteobacteria bacterium]|nr:hypothetical protein [Deltaproteobacteria bacterium]
MKSALFLIATLAALGACVDDTDSEDATDETLDRRKPQPAPTPPPPPEGGSFTCYSTSDPSATCSAGEQCCFDGTASHSGSCSSTSCSS